MSKKIIEQLELEKLRKSVIEQSCPSDFGFEDIEDCEGTTEKCISCWNREVKSDEIK